MKSGGTCPAEIDQGYYVDASFPSDEREKEAGELGYRKERSRMLDDNTALHIPV